MADPLNVHQETRRRSDTALGLETVVSKVSLPGGSKPGRRPRRSSLSSLAALAIPERQRRFSLTGAMSPRETKDIVKQVRSRRRREQVVFSDANVASTPSAAPRAVRQALPKSPATSAFLRKALSQIFLLSQLGDFELDEVLGLMDRITLKPEEVLVNKGEMQEQVYIVESGELELTRSWDGADAAAAAQELSSASPSQQPASGPGPSSSQQSLQRASSAMPPPPPGHSSSLHVLPLGRVSSRSVGELPPPGAPGHPGGAAPLLARHHSTIGLVRCGEHPGGGADAQSVVRYGRGSCVGETLLLGSRAAGAMQARQSRRQLITRQQQSRDSSQSASAAAAPLAFELAPAPPPRTPPAVAPGALDAIPVTVSHEPISPGPGCTAAPESAVPFLVPTMLRTRTLSEPPAFSPREVPAEGGARVGSIGGAGEAGSAVSFSPEPRQQPPSRFPLHSPTPTLPSTPSTPMTPMTAAEAAAIVEIRAAGGGSGSAPPATVVWALDPSVFRNTVSDL
jgi:CRP-like cAMP-binding protein